MGCSPGVHVDDHLVGRGALAAFGTDIGEISQRPQPLGRVPDLARVEGIAFDRGKLPADDRVERRCVALDVDAFDKDALAAGQGECQVQRLAALVAGDARLDIDEVQPLARSASASIRRMVVSMAVGL